MKILVTGSRGHVGASLSRQLLNRGHEVIGCDLAHGPHEAGYLLRADEATPTYTRCDVREYRQLERTFSTFGPFDLVYHCAAEFGRWNGEDFYENLWQTNAIGTKHIIRLQESLGFRLVHCSSSEVYGDWPDLMVETVMDEYEIRQMNDYAMTKWVNEMQIRNSAQLNGTETVIIRLFNVYGPGEHYSPYRSVNCRFVYCALAGIPFTVFRGHQRTSTYVEDMSNTLANIAERFKPGEVYNICGSYLHSIEESAELVLKVTGAPPSLVHYRGSEVLTTTVKRVDITKSERDLGHTNAVSLEDGLRMTADWMRGIYDFQPQSTGVRPAVNAG